MKHGGWYKCRTTMEREGITTATYGLKSSGLRRQENFDGIFKDIGFIPCPSAQDIWSQDVGYRQTPGNPELHKDLLTTKYNPKFEGNDSSQLVHPSPRMIGN